MTALATHDDLAARLGVTLTSDMQARADTLLGTASDLVRAHTKQQITLVEDDVLTIPGIWGDRILLPQRPVVDVSHVSATFYDGTPYVFATPTYFVDRDELVRYPFPIGLMRHFFTTGNGWLGPGYKISITYTHGYDPDASPTPYPLALAKATVLEMVSRVWVNPEAAQQSMIGGIQTMYPAQGLRLTADEKADLDDVFRRTSQTIPLR